MFGFLRDAFTQRWRLNVEKSKGFHRYYESSVTGDRKVITSNVKVVKQSKSKPAILMQAHQPVDIDWLKSAKSGRYVVNSKAHKTEDDFNPRTDTTQPPLPRNAKSAIRQP